MDTRVSSLPIVGLVYKLTIGDYWYVGSTTEMMRARMEGHYEACKKYPDRKIFKAIADNGGWGKVKVEVIDMFINLSGKKSLRERENKHIVLTDVMCLNGMKAYATKEDKKEQDKLYYKQRCENPELLAKAKEQRKEYIKLVEADPVKKKHRRVLHNAAAKRLRAKKSIESPETKEDKEKRLAYHREYYRKKRAEAKTPVPPIDETAVNELILPSN